MCGQRVECAIAVRSAGWQIVAGYIKAAHFAIFTYLLTYSLTYFMERSPS